MSASQGSAYLDLSRKPVLQDALVEMAKNKGKYENGIVSLQGMQSIKVISRELIHVDSSSGKALMPGFDHSFCTNSYVFSLVVQCVAVKHCYQSNCKCCKDLMNAGSKLQLM